MDYGNHGKKWTTEYADQTPLERMWFVVKWGAVIGGSFTSVYMYLNDIPKARIGEPKLKYAGRASAMVGFGAFALASTLGMAIGLKDQFNSSISGDYRVKTFWGSMLAGFASGAYFGTLFRRSFGQTVALSLGFAVVPTAVEHFGGFWVKRDQFIQSKKQMWQDRVDFRYLLAKESKEEREARRLAEIEAFKKV